MILWILFAWLFVGGVLAMTALKNSRENKTFKLTCVSHDGSFGVLTLEARTSKEAIAEAESYPAVKRVIVWEEITGDNEI